MSEPVAFQRGLTRGPAGNRTTTGSLSATQECAIPTAPRGRLASFLELCAGAGNIEIVERGNRKKGALTWRIELGRCLPQVILKDSYFGSMVWPKHRPSIVAVGPLQFLPVLLFCVFVFRFCFVAVWFCNDIVTALQDCVAGPMPALRLGSSMRREG